MVKSAHSFVGGSPAYTSIAVLPPPRSASDFPHFMLGVVWLNFAEKLT